MEEGNPASPPRSKPGWRTAGTILETIQNDNGDLYEGEVKDGKRHGRGVCKFASGAVYDGEWKDDLHHGIGTFTHTNGSVYEGGWVEGKQHGRVTVKGNSGNTYVGEVEGGKMHGWGEFTYADGDTFEGKWRKGFYHGEGTVKFASGDVYKGHWVGGDLHGRGIMTKSSGEVFDEEWVDGQRVWAKARGAGTSPGANEWKQSEEETRTNKQPTKDQRLYDERTLRSANSQQRRLHKNVTTKKCEHCGADDVQYKLRVCSGCNLALYCSAACQKAARRSHQRICDISSELPSQNANRLVLEYNKQEMADLDAGLRYGAKYMPNLKHLAIDLDEMEQGDSAKLSAKQLSSLLRSKKGSLDSLFLISEDYHDEVHCNFEHDTVWRELHSLKQLRLEFARFDGIQSFRDVIGQQKDTLEGLCLRMLDIDWHKAKTRRALAQAVNSCKHLVKLELCGSILMDSDLKIMLNALPSLRIHGLRRNINESHEFTNNTCGLIARKCPNLQELNLMYHDQLTVRGIRKIFEGCTDLRSFYTTARKLGCNDVQDLLGIAPQLLHLALDEMLVAREELDAIIEATGGRVVVQLNVGGVFEPDNVSAETREKYERQNHLLDNNYWGRRGDPEVLNEWTSMFEG